MTTAIDSTNAQQAATAVSQYCNEHAKGKAKQRAIYEAMTKFMGFNSSNTASAAKVPQAPQEDAAAVIAVNLFGADLDVIGTQHMAIPLHGIGDIISHLNQFVCYLRKHMPEDMTVVDVEADAIFSEMVDALETYGIIPDMTSGEGGLKYVEASRSEPQAQAINGMVSFHDRGVGYETRIIHDGKIQFRLVDGNDPLANEMLYQELFDEVEQKIANGETSGKTSDPCYPDWDYYPTKE